MEKPPVLKQIEAILRAEETADIEPPWSCLPVGDTKWIELKAKRIEPLIQQARQDTAREIFKYVKRLKNPHDYKKHFLSYIEFWRAKRHILGKLKTKYLIPPNPVGAGDV